MKAISVLIIFTFIGFPKYIQSKEKNDEEFKNRENFELMDKKYIQSKEKNDEEFKNRENFELIDTTSELEVKGSQNLKFYENKDITCKSSIKKYEDLVKIIDNYVQRYVSLFLITSNLRDYEIKDLNDFISVDLEISLTGEDLTYLQNYSKSTKDSFYPKNLPKLDAIFSKIARLKERSFAANVLRSSKSFFSNSNYFSALSNLNFYQFLSLLITLLMTWIFHHYLFHKSFYVFLGLTLNSMILWEALNKYWKKLKETEVEIFVQSLKGAPEECNYANLRWYHNLLNYFSGGSCLQYHKNLNKNPVEEVSLLECIIDTYSFYLIRTPFKIYGATIRDLTEEITALWPRPIRYFINFPFAPIFGVLIALFILILCRKQLRLSFFGAALEIRGAQRITENQRPVLTSCEMPTNVRVIRKLKPWTKSRFPKRLEGNIRKRKKLFLRASRSESESPPQDEQY